MQKGLFGFERTHLERLKLACDVLLELAGDDQISDGLEVELGGFKEQVERELLMPDRPGPGNGMMTWNAGIDLEEVRGKLEGSRTIRFALDSLEGNLPAHLISGHLESEFIALREKLAEMDRKELRKIGHRDYMILAPRSHVRHLGGEAAAAVRTLAELGLIIPLAG